MGAWAQLVGMPIAWLRLRKTPAWQNRPAGLRRLDLLARFMLKATALTILWGALIWAVAILGGLGFSGGALLVMLGGAPLLFVPWTVLRLDKSGFPGIVEKARKAREQKFAARR